MAQPLRDPQALQQQLRDFQELQRQMQFILAQRQQLSLQVEEIKLAETEIAKVDKGIYRAIGPLLVETTKSEANTTLKERRELFETRITVLGKQEEKLRPRLDELRAKLEAALQQQGKAV